MLTLNHICTKCHRSAFVVRLEYNRHSPTDGRKPISTATHIHDITFLDTFPCTKITHPSHILLKHCSNATHTMKLVACVQVRIVKAKDRMSINHLYVRFVIWKLLLHSKNCLVIPVKVVLRAQLPRRLEFRLGNTSARLRAQRQCKIRVIFDDGRKHA